MSNFEHALCSPPSLPQPTDLTSLGYAHMLSNPPIFLLLPACLPECAQIPEMQRAEGPLHLKKKSHTSFQDFISSPCVLSASPSAGMAQARCTPVLVSSLLPQTGRRYALSATSPPQDPLLCMHAHGVTATRSPVPRSLLTFDLELGDRAHAPLLELHCRKPRAITIISRQSLAFPHEQKHD